MTIESSERAQTRHEIGALSTFTRRQIGIAAVGLLAYSFLLFFPGLGNRELTSSHEARAAQNAQMILDEGQWLVPMLFDRHLELQKPPLYYWAVALFGWLNGGIVDAWIVRLPAAFSGIVTIAFLIFAGVRAKRPVAGILAAFILATCIHFTWLAQVGRIDMPLTMTITIALGSHFLACQTATTTHVRLAWHALGYVSLGFGLLLKGPIAVVLPAVVVALHWLLMSRKLTGRTSLWWGGPVTLAIAAPWYLIANLRTENQIWEVFFWYHNVERGLGGSETLASHPWWFYGPRVLVDCFPWSLMAPVAICFWYRREELRQDKIAVAGLVWFVAVAGFLSCMRFKRADYLLPAYPGLAIFLGVCGEQVWNARSSRVLAAALGAFAAVYAGAWLAFAVWTANGMDHPYRTLATEIRRGTSGPVVFFRAESHMLSFHLGKPVVTVLEWENLEAWAKKPRPIFVVMPESCATEWRHRLGPDSLEEVIRSTDFAGGQIDRPLVVLRNRHDCQGR